MNINSLVALLNNFFENPEVASFRLMTQGKENITALVEMRTGRVIVRMWGETHGYMGFHSENDIDDEVAFMDFCNSHNLPVPRIIRSKSGKLYEKTPEGRCYTVMEYAAGGSPQDFTKDMAAQIAEVMARMHILVTDFRFPKPRSWPGTVLDMTNDRIAKFEAGEFKIVNPVVTEAVGLYRSKLESCDLEALPKGVIHGDIMWENMKFKDGQLRGIFDFGDCRESYFVEDIAKTLLFAFESPEHCVFGEKGDNVPVFLEAYEKTRKLTTAEKQSLPLFFLSRFLYQVLGYYAKSVKGETGYVAKADGTIARYKQHQKFFA